MKAVTGYSPYQFAVFRIIFGVYLAIHFAQLAPYAGELFSSSGMLPDPALNPTYGSFPNLLNVLHTPAHVTAVLLALVVLSMVFAAGIRRQPIAVALWYGWACLFNRNMLISNPSLPYIGWLVLATALVPGGEPLRLSRKKDQSPEGWQMPPMIYWGAWFLLGLGYTASGIHKVGAPSWQDGTALMHVMQIPLARDNILRDVFLAMPSMLLKLLTWGALSMETLFFPLMLWRRTRPFAWLALVLMHIGILFVVNFGDLTFGMLMIHIFCFDPRWLKARKPAGQPVVFFDGNCALCNSTVDFIISEDREGIYLFAPLQGETAARNWVESRNVHSTA